MRTDRATFVLLIIPMIAAWGCRSEPDGPATGPRPASGSSDSRPAAGSAAPGPSVDQAPDKLVLTDAESKRLAEIHRQEMLTRRRAKAVSTGDSELDPLVSFLRAHFAEEIQAGKKLMIEDHLEFRHLGRGDSESLLKEASDQAPADMIRDFCEKNRQAGAVWPELTRHLPGRLLSRAEYDAIFNDSPREGWKRFYEKYPDAPGIITVSRVGLNREKDRALLYMGVSRGSLNGEGQLYVLKREGDEWVEVPVQIGPSWVS